MPEAVGQHTTSELVTNGQQQTLQGNAIGHIPERVTAGYFPAGSNLFCIAPLLKILISLPVRGIFCLI